MEWGKAHDVPCWASAVLLVDAPQASAPAPGLSRTSSPIPSEPGTDRFIIGPAIDEAAIWMNCAQGAFVVLAPSAARYPQAEVPSSISNLVRYQCR